MDNPAKHSTLRYRSDIDGLRAIAVLIVVCFHLGVKQMSGGFIGVDVFFVISGYLIGSILLRDFERDTFTFKGFYERRIRRIVPALSFLLIVVFVAGYKLLFPAEFMVLMNSMVAAILSVSNFYFLYHSNYFDPAATAQPLLHTWSLAVEEQFYILFPIILLLLKKFAWKKRNVAILGLFALSFVASTYGVLTNRSQAFYLPSSRAWELLIGVIVTLPVLPRLQDARTRNLISIAGLLCILIPAFIYTPSTIFPGPAALPPCLGSALIIWAGRDEESYVGRLLSFPPMVFIGTISYSLYLLHWPIIVFTGMSSLPQIDAGSRAYQWIVRGSELIVSVLLSYLSYRFVETPFRNKQIGRRMIFSLASGTLASLIILCIYVLHSNGLKNRFAPQAVAASRFINYDPTASYRMGQCFITSVNTYQQYRPSQCLQVVLGRKNYLLVGDSHAAQLWIGLSSTFPDVNIMQATASGCLPTIIPNKGESQDCRKLINYIYKDFIPSHHIDGLILSARWEPQNIQQLQNTVMSLRRQGVNVALVGPSVEYSATLPRLIAKSLNDDDPREISAHRVTAIFTLDQKIRNIALTDQLKYLSPIDVMCHQGTCDYMTGTGVPLLFDRDHFTMEGSQLIAEGWKERQEFP